MDRPTRLVLTTLVALFGTTLAHAEPRHPTHVACVGDSITEGKDDARWTSLLQDALGNSVQVGNFGQSGHTMLTNAYAYNPTEAVQFVQDAPAGSVVSVIIALGTNDSKSGFWMPDGAGKQDVQFENDALALIDTFTSLPNQPVVYLALPPWSGVNGFDIDNETVENEIIPILEKVAAARGVFVIDAHTPTRDRPELVVDGVHPNPTGAELLAQVMQAGLERVPSITIASPTDGEQLPPPVTLEALVDSGNVPLESVEFFVDSESLGVFTESPFSIPWENATFGQHVVSVEARDVTSASHKVESTFTVGEPQGDANATKTKPGGCQCATAPDGTWSGFFGAVAVGLLLSRRRAYRSA